jgi:glycosyltransferase involved in cell wall biosynthesis
VWPHLVRSGCPPLTVVGRDPQALPARLADHPGVRLVGAVDDVAAELAAATVVALPLRSGGGTRIKLVEALAHGRPTVTTTKAAEGVDVVAGRHALVADDPAGFAAAVLRVRSDPELRAALGAAGRDLVRALDWRQLADAFARVVGSP